VQNKVAPDLPSKIPALDGLRAIAILLVILAHSIATRPGAGFLAPLGHVGNIGVRLFFIISGFLITTLLLREIDARGNVSLANFYARRSLRILPAFIFYVAAVQLLAALNVFASPRADAIAAITFTMNYREHSTWFLQHLWSLSVEEQFYLLWGLLFAVATVSLNRLVIAALAVVPLAVRCCYVFWSPGAISATGLARRFECVADTLALGALLAVWFTAIMRPEMVRKFFQSKFSLWIAFTFIVIGVGCFGINGAVYYSLGQSLTNVGLGGVLLTSVTAIDGRLAKILNCPIAVFLGIISYSLYLWQELFIIPMEGPWYTTFPLNVLLSFVAAFLSYRLIERPFLGLRRHFPSR
jgi:peptidoglycan/LPS O-acetylase OafA/YrhL